MNPINHVAIIMDGNGRVGVYKIKVQEVMGHKQGIKNYPKK